MIGKQRRLTDDEAEAVFVELYEETYRQVLAYCRRRTRTPADAEDVLASTYLVAWRHIEDVADARTPLAWLYGVARRTLANHRRGLDRRQRLIEKLEGASRPEGLNPLTSTEWAERVRAVDRALASLPETDQELLALAAFEELPYKRIAEALDTTTPAIRTRLYRARRRLQRAFEVFYGEWDLR